MISYIEDKWSELKSQQYIQILVMPVFCQQTQEIWDGW